MRNETPNERNFRLLAERFKYCDKIVYDDGKDQYTLEMLKEMNPLITCPAYYGYQRRYLCGNEAILFLLESKDNHVPRHEIQDLINRLHKEIGEQYRPLSPKEVEEMEKEFPFENEIENGNEMHIDFGNEPVEIKITDINGNEKHHKVETIRYNGNENELTFFFENENENELGNGNETRNENENENGLLDMLRYSYNQIKKLL